MIKLGVPIFCVEICNEDSKNILSCYESVVDDEIFKDYEVFTHCISHVTSTNMHHVFLSAKNFLSYKEAIDKEFSL